LRSGPGRTVPMASLTASALLNGTSVRVDTRVAMGASHVTVTGDAPLGPAGVLGLRLDGAVDLAMLNPFLAVDGRRVRGQLSVEATVGGTIAAPQVKGRAALAKGDFDDSSLGANLDAITATVDADGDMLHVTQLTARAGAGILQASG